MTNEKNTSQEKLSQKRKRSKPQRRGTGSVFRRPERKGGKEWIAQILLENGKTKQTYHNTQTEAEGALNEMLYEQRRGMLVTGPRETVQHYLEYWLEEVHKPRVRESSYVRYHSIMRLHILPSLGHLQLQELTPRHIQTLYAQKAKEQYSTSTIRGMHAVLHQALDNAVRLGSLSRNVSDNMPIPRTTEREITPLTVE